MVVTSGMEVQPLPALMVKVRVINPEAEEDAARKLATVPDPEAVINKFAGLAVQDAVLPGIRLTKVNVLLDALQMGPLPLIYGERMVFTVLGYG